MSTTECIRCGKLRILAKKWKERIENKGNEVTIETYVCPDPECQKIVDAKFEEMRKKRIDSENRKTQISLKKN